MIVCTHQASGTCPSCLTADTPRMAGAVAKAINDGFSNVPRMSPEEYEKLRRRIREREERA